MKLHRGAVFDRVYRHITGNVPGEGMSADEIVAVISEHGYNFVSGAPDLIPADLSRSEYVGGTHANGYTFTFSPTAMGFPNQAVKYLCLVTFNIVLTNTGFTPPGIFPPTLQVQAYVGGCITPGTANENYTAYVSQSNPGTAGEEDVHRVYSFTMLCEIENCGLGGVWFSVAMDDIGTWANWADLVWNITASAVIVVEG